MDNSELINKAKRKVKDKKHFYAHFNAFCFVTLTLFFINSLTTLSTWFFVLPLSGWAMAVIGHYLNVFGFPSFKDQAWEDEQLEIELEKLERSQNQNTNYDNDESLDLSDDQLELKQLKEKRRNYNSDDFV